MTFLIAFLLGLLRYVEAGGCVLDLVESVLEEVLDVAVKLLLFLVVVLVVAPNALTRHFVYLLTVLGLALFEVLI